MLKNIRGMIDSVRHAFGSDTTLIKQGLGGIELLDKDMAAQAVDFVATGNRSEVLLRLKALDARVSTRLGAPGRLKWSFPIYNYDEDHDAGRHALAGRHVLYERSDASPANIAMLVRLGKVLEAADGGRSLDQTGSSAPDWLLYLLNDAMWSSYSYEKEDNMDAARAGKQRPNWDLALLAAILRHEELPEAMLLPIVFERRSLDSYYHKQVYVPLRAPGALDAYMLANLDAVNTTGAALSAAGRLILLQRIGSDDALLAAFTPLMLKFAVGDSKTVRAEAASFLEAMDKQHSTAVLQELLRSGQSEERANAAELLARTRGKEAVAMLELALETETSKTVQQAMRQALSRLQAAGDAAELSLPEPPPLPPPPSEVLGPDAIDLLLANRTELLTRLRLAADNEAEENKGRKHAYTWQLEHYQHYKLLTEDELRRAVQALNGEGGKRASDMMANSQVRETLAFGGRLEARADFGLLQVLRWNTNHIRGGYGFWTNPHFQTWLRKQDSEQVDLRQLHDIIVSLGGVEDAIAGACLRETWGGVPPPQDWLPDDRIWPFFAAHPQLVDEGLGLAATKPGQHYAPSLALTLDVIATFPTLPARWLPRVMELALGEGKTHRAAAQEALSNLPDIGKQVGEALGSSKQELRIEAARWLARLGNKEAVPMLNAALAKETRETVSAALLTALEQLGEDISPRLAPQILLAQATKGLKAKPPAGLAWLNLDALPACQWLHGGAVEPQIIRWWVILACKLKEPGGNGLLERYMGLLAPGSRAALGSFLLHQFIARDTAHPPLEEGIAFANANAPQRYQQYQQWFKQYPSYHEDVGKLTEEQVFEQLKREKMGEYLGSAISEKGILALVSGMPGHELVSAIALYMRDHYQRRSQVEALLEAACLSDEPSVIQFVLGVARRYRTAAIQEKARVLVQRIAERNGWTEDQLADRTIPTGGLDEQGKLALQYGSRAYTVMLDAAMKPVLYNSDGKSVAALPAPRQDEVTNAAESIKEAKQLFATCKKEVKQVIDMQTARLYEAMCAGRHWPVAEWREYVLQHPLAGRLAQRLVWMTCAADGTPLQLFRPGDDGSLLDLDDDEVELGADAQVALAHGALIAPAQAAAWTAHFKDYKLKPLFAQMSRPAAPAPVAGQPERINDREGWTSDTFTLRGAFNKLGYQRGQGEDGGIFYEYRKDFTSAGMGVAIDFSGSALPEENMPAALKGLSFYGLDRGRYDYSSIALAEVPPVLLAEAYGDYHAIAAACAGFDPDWKKKMPW